MGSGTTPATTPVTARAHAFVDDLAAPVLAADDLHHLTRALRLASGALVTVSDGRGAWRPCRLQDGPSLSVEGDVVVDPTPEPPLTVAFALVKGERPDLVVQKLTELGVDRIAPFTAERSVVRWDADKAGRQARRWREIARQAAMQCRRTTLPQVDAVADFATVAALAGAVLADVGGGPPTLARPVVLVGPEGGWSRGEVATGLPSVSLGPNVLRAETAAITAGAVFAALRSRLIRSD
jgi:16S rRNA (uracil1498-N3)-methyltransferase